MRLMRRAILGGYNLTPEQRAKIVARASEILDAPPEVLESKDGVTIGVSYRDQLGAAKVLLACDKMDLEAEKMERGQAQGGTVNNTQIININATHKALQSEDGRNALAQLRRAISDGDAAAVGAD